MDAKLYLLAFYAMTISNDCDCAHDDKYLTRILHKLDEVKFEMDEKISTLENKVDEKISTLENKVDEKISTLENIVDEKISTLETKLTKRKDINTRKQS